MPEILTSGAETADSDLRRQAARRFADNVALPMFGLALVYLALIAGLIVTDVDMPRVEELARSEGKLEYANSQASLIAVADRVNDYFVAALLLMWPLFWVEFFLTLYYRDRSRPLKSYLSGFVAALFPPLRLGVSSRAMDRQLWLPVMGWQQPGKVLVRQLDSIFSKPMLVVAFLILPVLVLEYAFGELLARYIWLRLAVHVSTGLIWWCFAAEFIVMVGASDKRLAYIKRNWIDLAIILLPLISFLRSIRVLRLAQVTKVQQISKVTRVYRMRGLALKLMRGFVVTELITRILRVSPEKKLARLREEYADRSEELEELAARIQVLEKELHDDTSTAPADALRD